MADALLYYDFALTAPSTLSVNCAVCLRTPAIRRIPTRAVPEAHTFVLRRRCRRTTGRRRSQPCRTASSCCASAPSLPRRTKPLLQIWQLLIREGIEPPLLVLVGRRGHNINDLLSQLATSNNLDGRVHIFEGLSDSELQTLYRNCLFTMLPSFVEGWGLPVGESLAYGKLCIASDAASLPEVGGEFVLYIDPYNARAAAILVRRLLEDRTELRRLEARIRRRIPPAQLARAWRGADRGGEEAGPGGAAGGKQAKTGRHAAGPGGAPISYRDRPGEGDLAAGPPNRCRPGVASAAPRRRLVPDGIVGRMDGRPPWPDRIYDRGKYDRPVRVVLQFQAAPWAWGNSLTIRAACGATTIVPVPESRYRVDAYPRFLAWLDCTPDRTGRIALTLEIFGDLPEPWWGETRRFCVGLAQLLCLEPTELMSGCRRTGSSGRHSSPGRWERRSFPLARHRDRRATTPDHARRGLG